MRSKEEEEQSKMRGEKGHQRRNERDQRRNGEDQKVREKSIAEETRGCETREETRGARNYTR